MSANRPPQGRRRTAGESPEAAAGDGAQLALVAARAGRSRRRPRPESAPAARRPVARVVVDTTPHHLDRPFDYLVPEKWDALALPGVRVRVPFNRQVLDGFLIERVDGSAFGGRLRPLSAVVSGEPVLSPGLLRLARAVADRYAGTLADVLQLAIPPRHAAVEAEPGTPDGSAGEPSAPSAGGVGPWGGLVDGPGFLTALADGGHPRAVVAALPGTWPGLLAQAAAAAVASGRGAVLVVPSGRELDRLDTALTEVLGAGRHVALAAELGPAERYRRWLAAARGRVRVVAGTRAAAFAPVEPCGLVAVVDDGDELHLDPRAPYPHVREVLALRSHLDGAGFLICGHAVSAEGAGLVASGWARALRPEREVLRSATPLLRTTADDVELARDPGAAAARLPSVAWRTARDGLAAGPVLVQVPRRGYVPALACAGCRTPAACSACQGPLALTGPAGTPVCRWCGRPAGNAGDAGPDQGHGVAAWRCAVCGGTRLRARAVGAGRTAEELGRAFPSVPVRISGRDGVLAAVDDRPALVVATPGAEPVAAAGYAAALLLDGHVLLGRADLRGAEDAVRLWLNAAALVRPREEGGRVVLTADAQHPAVQAVLRWDPAGFAERELADRAALHFPPTARIATVTGDPDTVADVVSRLDGIPGLEVLGPVEAEPEPRSAPRAAPAVRRGDRPRGAATSAHAVEGEPVHRALVRVPRSQGRELATRLHAAQAAHSAGHGHATVRVRVDPYDLG